MRRKNDYKRERKSNSSFNLHSFYGIWYPLIRYISTIFQTVNTNALMFLAGGLLFISVSSFKFKSELLKLKNILDYFQDLYL